MKTNTLLIIFTLFDYGTERYLQLFDANIESKKPKAVSFDRCCNDAHTMPNDHSCDILIFHEEEFTPKCEDLLSRVIEKKTKIYLTRHQSHTSKDFLENRIMEIASEKLQFPIKDESHTIDGNAFNLLVRIGQSRRGKNKNKNDYYKYYQAYLDSFFLDVELEAKLDLMHSCCKPANTKDILSDFPNKGPVDAALKQLVQQVDLNPLILRLTQPHDKEQFLSHYKSLHQELFKD